MRSKAAQFHRSEEARLSNRCERQHFIKALLLLPLLGAPLMGAPQEVLTQKALSLDMAEKIASLAVKTCHADGFHVSVTVLDGSGLLKAALTDDGAAVYTMEFSHRKAYTSYMYRRPSGEVAKNWEVKPPVYRPDGLVAAAGGLPIKAGDQVIGAIGVSGAPGGEKDEACASAAIAAVADPLNK
jgi:uncharacterized protein GlcG (DUF336 family)